MKKRLLFFVTLFAAVLAGCQAPATTNQSSQSSTAGAGATSNQASAEKPVVTATTSFLADMVKQIAGDTVTVETVIPAGEDPHLYIAKSGDLNKIEKANLVLYHGLHFEGKMVDILEQKGVAVSKNFKEDQIGRMEEDGEQVIDPHFWFDIALYQEAVKTTSESLQSLVPENQKLYAENTEKYLKQLDDLDKELKEKLAKIPEESRYLITPHDAFNYFAKSYQVTVHAPQGVSTDSEVATQDVQETVDLIVDKKIKAIFAESTTDPARMEKLKEAVQAKGFTVTVVSGEGNELFSDSLAPEGEFGDTYIDMYRHNVDLIIKYLQ